MRYRWVSNSWNPSSLKEKRLSTICCVKSRRASTCAMTSRFNASILAGDCCAVLRAAAQVTTRTHTAESHSRACFVPFSITAQPDNAPTGCAPQQSAMAPIGWHTLAALRWWVGCAGL